MNILDRQLEKIENKRKEVIDATVTSTNYLDKMHEIAMNTPDIWGSMKVDGFRNTYMEDKGGATFVKTIPKRPFDEIEEFN
jgi:hypothetical protein